MMKKYDFAQREYLAQQIVQNIMAQIRQDGSAQLSYPAPATTDLPGQTK